MTWNGPLSQRSSATIPPWNPKCPTSCGSASRRPSSRSFSGIWKASTWSRTRQSSQHLPGNQLKNTEATPDHRLPRRPSAGSGRWTLGRLPPEIPPNEDGSSAGMTRFLPLPTPSPGSRAVGQFRKHTRRAFEGTSWQLSKRLEPPECPVECHHERVQATQTSARH